MKNHMRIDENIGEAGFSGLGTRYLGSREHAGWSQGEKHNFYVGKGEVIHIVLGVSFVGILPYEEEET